MLQQAELGELTRRGRVPAIHAMKGFVVAGGLLAYGPSVPDLARRAATYVDKNLRGAKPADLPVEQPMVFEFSANMATARALGITFPSETMLQVTDVVQ